MWGRIRRTDTSSANRREREKRINQFAQYKTTVKDSKGSELKIHFAALFSGKEGAVPLVLLHGWPGSYLEFIPTLELLKSQGNQNFNVIVPSLPGFGWSDRPPLGRDWKAADTAFVLNELMTGLGFTAYVAQGGDIGSTMSRLLAVNHKECKAVHLNFMFLSKAVPDDLSHFSERDQHGLKRTNEFRKVGSAYAFEQGTKPGTLGFALASNPVSLLAW